MATHRRRSYLPLFTLLSLGWVHEAHAGVSHSPGRTDDESQRSTGAQVARETATLEVKPALLRQHRLTATTEPAAPPAAPKTAAPPPTSPPPNTGPAVEAPPPADEATTPEADASETSEASAPSEASDAADTESSGATSDANADADDTTDTATTDTGEAAETPDDTAGDDATDDASPDILLDPFAQQEGDSSEDETAEGDSSGMAPKHSIAYSNLTVARLNPLGLMNRTLIEYRYRLYDTPSLLKNDSYISVGVEPFITPAMARVSGTIFVKPLAILRLRASYGVLAHYGNFQFTQSYDTPTAEYFTAEYYATKDNRYATVGSQGIFGALLQAKVGPVAIRNDLNFYRTDVDLEDNTGLFGDDDVFYYIQDDMMIAAHGWHMTNDTDVLYIADFGLTAGIRTTVTKAFYPDDVFLPGESTDDPNGPSVRMGPLIAYTFYDKPEEKKRFNKPSILLVTQWWLKHRYRTGAAAKFGESISVDSEGNKVAVGSLGDSIPAMPWFVLGFAFQGELFARD